MDGESCMKPVLPVGKAQIVGVPLDGTAQYRDGPSSYTLSNFSYRRARDRPLWSRGPAPQAARRCKVNSSPPMKKLPLSQTETSPSTPPEQEGQIQPDTAGHGPTPRQANTGEGAASALESLRKLERSRHHHKTPSDREARAQPHE